MFCAGRCRVLLRRVCVVLLLVLINTMLCTGDSAVDLAEGSCSAMGSSSQKYQVSAEYSHVSAKNKVD